MNTELQPQQDEVIQLKPDALSLSEQLRDSQYAVIAIEPETRTQWFQMIPPAREGWYEAYVHTFDEQRDTTPSILNVDPTKITMAYFRDYWIMDQRCIEWLIPIDETHDTWQEVYCDKWRGLYEFPAQPWKLEEPKAILKRFTAISREDVYYMHRLEQKYKKSRVR